MKSKEQRMYKKLEKKHDRLYKKADKKGILNIKPEDKKYQKYKELQDQLVEYRLQMADLAAQAGDGLDYYCLARLYSKTEYFKDLKNSYRGAIHFKVAINIYELHKYYPFWENSEEKALHYLQSCIEVGGDIAILAKQSMVYFYRDGIGTEKDMSKYISILTDLVEVNGDRNSALELGDYYYYLEESNEKKLWFCDANYEKAAHFYTLGAGNLQDFFSNANSKYDKNAHLVNKRELEKLVKNMEVINSKKKFPEAKKFLTYYYEWIEEYNRKQEEIQNKVRKAQNKIQETQKYMAQELGQKFYRIDGKGRRVELDKNLRDKPLIVVAAYKILKDNFGNTWTQKERYDTYLVYHCDNTGEIQKIYTDDIVDLDEIRRYGIDSGKYHFYLNSINS